MYAVRRQGIQHGRGISWSVKYNSLSSSFALTSSATLYFVMETVETNMADRGELQFICANAKRISAKYKVFI